MTGDLFGDEGALEAPRLNVWNPHDWPVQADWQPVMDAFWRSASGLALAEFVQSRLAAGAVVYPAHPLRAMQLTPLSHVKVVILGQDPYHGPYQAQGMAFSVGKAVRPPPSLRNIFKELQRDLGQSMPRSGSLDAWARRGVLLLNASLTVENGLPASHAQRGWEVLTDAVLRAVALTAPACAYLLWGAHAQAKASLIKQASRAVGAGECLILQANHPSPLSALRAPKPFIGCGHFSASRQWLAEKGITLDWDL